MKNFVKYTKTSTFLFPLLDIPKEIFSCDIRKYGKTIMSTRFWNSFIVNDHLKNDSYNEGPYLFLVIKGYQDVNFEAFYTTLTGMLQYIDDYEYNGYFIMIFEIPEDFLEDYDLILKGKYSEISAKGKSNILSKNFFSGKPKAIPMILMKSDALKNSWEKNLSFFGPDINSPADLGDQEVWSRIIPENETLTSDMLTVHSNKLILTE
jgi:hypothetical protein